MKTKLSIIIGVLAVTFAAFAGISPNYELFQPKHNTDCESGKGKWTASTPSHLGHTTSALMGSGSCTFQATGGAETFDTALVAIPEAMRSQPCVVSYLYKLPTTSNLVLQMHDGTSLVGSSHALAVTASVIQDFFTLTCPASGSLKLRGTSSGASGLLTIDEVKVSVVNQSLISGTSSLVGEATWAATANCSWENQTTGAMNLFAADADCPDPTVTGGVSAPGTKIPAAVITAVNADYRVCFQGPLMVDKETGAGNEYCQWQVTDGTVTSSILEVQQDSVTYEELGQFCGILRGVAAGSRTFQLQTRVWSDGGTATKCLIRPDTAATQNRPTNTTFRISVEKM